MGILAPSAFMLAHAKVSVISFVFFSLMTVLSIIRSKQKMHTKSTEEMHTGKTIQKNADSHENLINYERL